MKKLLLAAIVLLSTAISCNDAAKTENTAKTVSHKDHVMMVYAGIESGDMSKVDEFIAEDIVDHMDMGDVKGRDSVKKVLADIHNHFSNLKFDAIAEATSASGDYNFTLVHMTGTTKDASMGRPANTALDQTSVDVVKWVNGKAVEHWGYANPQEMMKMMNMNKPAEPAALEKKDSLVKK